MRGSAIVLVGMLVLTTALAFAPAAEARQVCTYGTGDPCDDHVVCVWDRVNGAWVCEGYIDPCWFRCW
jgi:hypothetical protein